MAPRVGFEPITFRLTSPSRSGLIALTHLETARFVAFRSHWRTRQFFRSQIYSLRVLSSLWLTEGQPVMAVIAFKAFGLAPGRNDVPYAADQGGNLSRHAHFASHVPRTASPAAGGSTFSPSPGSAARLVDGLTAHSISAFPAVRRSTRCWGVSRHLRSQASSWVVDMPPVIQVLKERTLDSKYLHER